MGVSVVLHHSISVQHIQNKHWLVSYFRSTSKRLSRGYYTILYVLYTHFILSTAVKHTNVMNHGRGDLQGKDCIDNTKTCSRTLLRFKFPYLSSVWQMYSSSTLWNPGVTLGFSNQPRIIQTKLTFVPLSNAEIHSQFFEIHENLS